MDEKRQKEIAIKLVVYLEARDGIKLTPGSRRELTARSKRMGQPLPLLLEFEEKIADSLIDFACGLRAEFKPELPVETFGNLALAILSDRLRREGMRLQYESVRKLGELAAALHVSIEELQAFSYPQLKFISSTFFHDEKFVEQG